MDRTNSSIDFESVVIDTTDPISVPERISPPRAKAKPVGGQKMRKGIRPYMTKLGVRFVAIAKYANKVLRQGGFATFKEADAWRLEALVKKESPKPTTLIITCVEEYIVLMEGKPAAARIKTWDDVKLELRRLAAHPVMKGK